jgi:hypothetical protein
MFGLVEARSHSNVLSFSFYSSGPSRGIRLLYSLPIATSPNSKDCRRTYISMCHFISFSQQSFYRQVLVMHIRTIFTMLAFVASLAFATPNPGSSSGSNGSNGNSGGSGGNGSGNNGNGGGGGGGGGSPAKCPSKSCGSTLDCILSGMFCPYHAFARRSSDEMNRKLGQICVKQSETLKCCVAPELVGLPGAGGGLPALPALPGLGGE